MRLKMFAATAALALSFGATSASADCGEVSITEMDWASSAVTTADEAQSISVIVEKYL